MSRLNYINILRTTLHHQGPQKLFLLYIKSQSQCSDLQKQVAEMVDDVTEHSRFHFRYRETGFQ
jgi:hypothetical protein